MKIVFTICLHLFFIHAFSGTIIIGNGSGSVVLENMKGLVPGDTVAIRAGFYQNGGSFTNLERITITNYNGVVDFGNTISLGNLKRVSILGAGNKQTTYGFRFQKVRADAFFLNAPCRLLTISNCEFHELEGTVFNASSFFVTYTGDPTTCALFKCRFEHLKLVRSGMLFMGSWASNALFQNVVDSISFQHIIIDSTMTDGTQVIGHSMYGMLAKGWRITGPCPNGIHDVGVFQTTGNGTVCDIYRNGGWGYLWRIWNIGLNGRAESYLYNCIDLGTINYGTIDTRSESADTTAGNTIPFLRGGSMHILNNTIGNKKTQGYVSQLAIIGHYGYTEGYRVEVRNNLCFNTVAAGNDPIIKQNTGEPLKDTSNNIYSKDPITEGLLLDTVECKLNPASPAIDNGINYPFIRNDIEGVPRPVGKSADIGAREFPTASVISHPKKVFFHKKWLLFGLGFLGIFSLIVGYLRKSRKKAEDSTYEFVHQALDGR